MPAAIIDSAYLGDLFGTARMRALFADEARLQAWLTVEAALARAQARLGLIPAAAAAEITDRARLANLDLAAMKAEFERVGFPILPLVHAFANACSPETARYVHWGSTTQDITDTGMALHLRAAFELMEQDLIGIEDALAALARAHRDTVMAGRTFQQQAAPITFGYKVAVWLAELHRHRRRLAELRPRALVGQCAGAVGTLATLGAHGLAVRRELMRELALGEPPISWHTARDGWTEATMWLGLVGATFGKIATEIAMLMRTEVDEVREPFAAGRGASSTLPQKRNPVSCQPVIAIARMLREKVGLALDAMVQEHERATGPMHLEWSILPEAFVLASGAAANLLKVLPDLTVDAARMRANLDLGRGLLMAESVMMGLAPQLGRNRAHDLVTAACARAAERGTTLREALMAEPEIAGTLSAAEIDRLLDPANYTGAAGAMVDSVLAMVRGAIPKGSA